MGVYYADSIKLQHWNTRSSAVAEILHDVLCFAKSGLGVAQGHWSYAGVMLLLAVTRRNSHRICQNLETGLEALLPAPATLYVYVYVSVRAAAAEILLPKSGSAADFTQRSILTVRCRQL